MWREGSHDATKMASAEAFLHRGLHMAASKGGGSEQKKEGPAINTAPTCGDEPNQEDASSFHVSIGVMHKLMC